MSHVTARAAVLRPVLAVTVVAGGCFGSADESADGPPTGADDSGAPPVAEPEPAGPAPARIATRRLNRSEYDRTVEALLGVDLELALSFPVDDATDGFDTVAEGLAVSPLLVELYERSASEIASTIIEIPLQEPVSDLYEIEQGGWVATSTAQGVRQGALGLYSGGTVTGQIEAPEAGRYAIAVRAWADQAGDDLPLVAVGVGLGATHTFEVAASDAVGADWLSFEAVLPKGLHPLSIDWRNDFYDAATGADRNLYLDVIEVEGPLDLEPLPNPAHDAVVVCEPDEALDARACVVSILERFVPRAWRRPVEPAEIAQLMELYDVVVGEGDPPSWGLEFALRAVFASPHFVFHVEPMPPADAADGVPIDDHILANRLSYLLWSAPPDDALWALAEDGTLHDPEVLAAQARRMLADDRSRALAEDFGGQWLMIRALQDAAPDFWAFPRFNEILRASMTESMVRFFHHLVQHDDLPVTDLVTADWGYVDRELALQLGMPIGLVDEGTWRFDDDLARYDRVAGWLTQPGLLTATSYPDRTSPVKRGVWVLSALLCDEPEPPPPGVEGFPEPDGEAVTVRDRLEAHRLNPACAVCHDDIDPVGLAFEHYDGLGFWRDTERGENVDASGTLPDGTTFYGVEELGHILADDPRLTACVAEKLYVYATGRGAGQADEAALQAIEHAATEAGGSMADLVTAIVTSDAFRMHGRPE